MGLAWRVARKVINTRYRRTVERTPTLRRYEMNPYLVNLMWRPDNDDLDDARAAIEVVMVGLGLVDFLMERGLTYPDAVEYLSEKLDLS